jgi:hypothetical protein
MRGCSNVVAGQRQQAFAPGYLFPPKENKDADEENEDPDKAPEWVMEAWDWLLRKELGLSRKKPLWLRFPAMMRMAMTSPNVMRTARPEWLAPYNFFFFPIVSNLNGYPQGFERSTFRFITPPEMNRRRWNNLEGINLLDGKIYRISRSRNGKWDAVVPDSFQIILNQYLQHPENKSLAPDGSACTANTRGQLQRSFIFAERLVAIGKEADRRWEQGEDPSMLDFEVQAFEKQKRTVIANVSLRKRWSALGVRRLMRESGLSQKTVYRILAGDPVRRHTMSNFRQVVEKITV